MNAAEYLNQPSAEDYLKQGQSAADYLKSANPYPDFNNFPPPGTVMTNQSAMSGETSPINPPTVMDRIKGGAEASANLATGGVAYPVGFVAGVMNAPAYYAGLSPYSPQEVASETTQALTYKPRTPEGQKFANVVNWPFREYGKAVDYLAGKTEQLTGSPGAGEAVQALGTYAPLLLGVGRNAGKGARVEETYTPSDPAAKMEAIRPLQATFHAGIPADQLAAMGKGAAGKIKEGVDSLIPVASDIASDLQLKIAPMAGGTPRARAIAKDYANAERAATDQWNQFDDILKKDFTPEQQKRMWQAADEQSVLMQQGVETTGKGMDILSPRERRVIEQLQGYGNQLLQRAQDLGMFKGEGLPSWTPRMVALIDEEGNITRPAGTPVKEGFNITKTAPSLKHRKYLTTAETEAAAKEKFGEQAQVIQNIRTMPMAMARLEKAIAGRELINGIKEAGKSVGEDWVSDTPGPDYFTVSNPAFQTFVPKQVPVQLNEYYDKLLVDGLSQVAKNIGVKHVRKGALKGGALGLAYRNKPLVETKFFTPDQVLTHEIGHQLDFKYGLADKLTRSGATAKELRALADLRYEGEKNVSESYKRYVRKGSEKIANLVHAYVHNPERFREVAPQTFRAFDAFINQHPELEILKELGPSLTLSGRTAEGHVTQWVPEPLYISKEFEGPLKSIMAERSGPTYKNLMALKGKSTSLIMYSPLIHNAVEWGRALPLMPGKVLTFRIYWEGNKIKHNPAIRHEAIMNGLVPIGRRFGYQDISGLMEEPTLKPGRSLTAKAAGGAAEFLYHPWGDKVRAAIDKGGDFWHNTLLWDRVGDLQFGLYANVKADLMKTHKLDELTAGRIAAHLANRYAGAIPNEAMSAMTRKVANVMYFSRSFTLGNLGVMKDMIRGLPRDVQAQILRDSGELMKKAGTSAARRKAIGAFMTDVALQYAGNALTQNAIDMLANNQSLTDIERGYVRRYHNLLKRINENPLELLNIPANIEALTPGGEHEPGKEYRILVGYDDKGTAIYARLPFGKIGEEFLGWSTSPLEMVRRKLGVIARPLYQTFANDKGYGRRVYNPDDPGVEGAVRNVGKIVTNFMEAQVPIISIESLGNIASGHGEKIDALRVIGPLFGLTFSEGAPGGPAVGTLWKQQKQHQAEVADAMPQIRLALKRGNKKEAASLMKQAHMTPTEVKWFLIFNNMPQRTITPRKMKEFLQTAPLEERQRMRQLLKEQRKAQ